MNECKGIAVRRFSELYTECSAEYVLPDYKGDVKRILHTEASVLPSGSFRDADEAEMTGIAVFDVLYLDAENNLTSVSFSADYSLKVPMKEELCDVFADFSAENASVRLPGPRKMMARCAVKGNVRMISEAAALSEGSALSEEYSPEVCTCPIESVRSVRASLGAREFAEEFFFASGAALDDVEVIAKRAEARVDSAVCEDGCVRVCGEISVFSLVKTGGAPCNKEKRIPFEECLQAADVRADMQAVASAAVSSLECRSEPTDDGVRVNVSAILDIDAEAFGNGRTEIVCDAFTPLAEVNNEYEFTSYDEFVDSKSKNVKVSAQIPKEETDAEYASDIVYLATTVKTESVKLEDNTVTLSGEVRFGAVACEVFDDAAPAYTPLKLSVPFTESVSFGASLPEGAALEWSVKSFDAKLSAGENSFYAESDVCIGVSAFCEREVMRLVSSEALSEPTVSRSANVVSVYYPEEGDTLFEVAKRFKTSPMKIASDNALTEETVSAKNSPASLAAVDKLIIKSL